MSLTTLGSVVTTSSTTLNLGSVTPTADATIYIVVGRVQSGGPLSSITLDVPTWLNGSWTLVATSDDGGNSEVIVWRGTVVSSPSADNVIITMGSAPAGASGRYYQDTDVVDPAVTVADTRGTSTTPFIDIGTPTVGNRQIVCAWITTTGIFTPDTDYTNIDNQHIFGNNVWHYVGESDPAQTDGEWTGALAGSASYNLVTIEVEPASTPPSDSSLVNIIRFGTFSHGFSDGFGF